MTNSLLKGLENVTEKDSIMVCFPHAGGGASFYYRWQKALEDICKVCPVQLPGREERMGEKPYTDISNIAEDVVEILKKYDNPMILYGHSMGTKIAYEVEKRMEQRGKPPTLMLVSACPPPFREGKNPIANLPEAEFVNELIQLNGIPKELAAQKELLHIFLPVLRADFVLSESYRCNTIQAIQCPLVVMGGLDDSEASEADLEAWKIYHPQGFVCQMFEGDHFYIRQQEKEVLQLIRKSIERFTAEEQKYAANQW